MRKLTFGVLLTLLAVSLLVLTGCGSSSSSTSESGSTTAGGTGESTGGSVGGAPADIATLQKYVGGKGKADSSMEPITIGFVNLEGGTPAAPESLEAAEAAIEAINEDLGGVQGHPVELKPCHIVDSEEEGQVCGQEMVNDPSVKLVVNSAVQVGAEALHQTIDGKVVNAVSVPLSVSDLTAKDSYALNAGLFGSTPGTVDYVLNVLKAKKVAVLGATDDPPAVQAVTETVKYLKEAGVEVEVAGFKKTATDLLAPLQAAGVADAEAVIAIVVGPPIVIAAAKALEQLNVTAPVIGIGAALQPGVKTALGDYPKWTFNEVTLNPAVPDPEGQVEAFKGVMEAYEPEAPLTADSTFAFSGMMTSLKILNEVKGELTTPAIAKAFQSFTGPGFLDPPHYKFGSIPIGPGLGTLESRFYTYEGDEKWSDATGGKWVGG